MNNPETQHQAYLLRSHNLSNLPLIDAPGEDECDSSGEIGAIERLGFWQYLQLLKNLDPETRRDILDIKFCILRLKFSNFRLECSSFFLQRRIRKLERKYGLAHDAPVLATGAMCAEGFLVTPNVRAKLAPTAWRAGQQAQNGAKPQRLMTSVPRRWGSA